MAKQPLVVHCPGFGMGEEDCEPLLDIYSHLGIRNQLVIPIWRDDPPRIPPKHGSLIRWDGIGFNALAMADIALAHSEPGETVLLSGHSTGGMIAMGAACIMEHMAWPLPRDTRLAVYSFAAYGNNQIHRIYKHNPDSDARRMSSGQRGNLGRTQVVPINSPAMAFCGKDEKRYTQDMFMTIMRLWQQVEGFVIDTGHNLNHPRYLQRIAGELPALLSCERDVPLPEVPLPPPDIIKAFGNWIIPGDDAPQWLRPAEPMIVSYRARPAVDQ